MTRWLAAVRRKSWNLRFFSSARSTARSKAVRIFLLGNRAFSQFFRGGSRYHEHEQ